MTDIFHYTDEADCPHYGVGKSCAPCMVKALDMKGARVRELESKLAAIRKAIVAYKSEQENPSKDYVMIRLRRKELFNTLSEARVKP